MINNFSKILLILMGLCYSAFLSAQSLNINQQNLLEADSLFANKRYTEALENYEEIFSKQQATPAMLLRMSFIHEGLDQVVPSMFYLNQYFQMTADREAIQKITNLAEANELRGYQFHDTDYIFNLISRYRNLVMSLLAALSVLAGVILWRRKKQEQSLVPALVFQILCVGLLFTLSNGLFEKNEAIITSGNTVLMNGPGAGAEPITVINKGHKVKVLEQRQFWSKITWNETQGYVRNHRILPI